MVWYGCLHCLEVEYYLNGLLMVWLLALPGGGILSELFTHGMSACIAWRWGMILTVSPWHVCLHCLEVGYYLNGLLMTWLLALPGGWAMIWTVSPWHVCVHCLEVGYYLNGLLMPWLLALPGGGVWSKLFPHGMSACIAWKRNIIWMICSWHGCLHCLEAGYDLNCLLIACLLALPRSEVWSELFAHDMAACIAWRWDIIWMVSPWYGCLHCLEAGYDLNCLLMACLLVLPRSEIWSELFAHGMAACIAWRWDIIWMVSPWHGCLHCLEAGYNLNCLLMACLLALPRSELWSELFAHGMAACIAWRWCMIWTIFPWHGCLHCLWVGYDLNRLPWWN